MADDKKYPPITCSPIRLHPSKPIVAWAAGGSFFAFNLATLDWDAKLIDLHDAPIRSLDFLGGETGDENAPFKNCWIVAAEDKQITVLDEPKGYLVKYRFVLPKRPQGCKVEKGGRAVIYGDKFGDLFRATVTDLERETENQLQMLAFHFKKNANDAFARKVYENVVRRFSIKFDEVRSKIQDTDKPSEKAGELEEDGFLIPFAGHSSAIVCVEMSADRQKLFSADRDEKIRIGGAAPPVLEVTHGYALDHTEFVTCLLAPADIPQILISGAGDRMLKVWEISSSDATLIDQVQLSHIPTSLTYSKDHSSIFVVPEDFSGIVRVELISVDENPEATAASALPTPAAANTVRKTPFKLSTPQKIHLETPLQAAVYIHKSHDNCAITSQGVLVAINRDGQILCPYTVTARGPGEIELQQVPGDVDWTEVQRSSPAIATPGLQLWKHNRLDTSPTDCQRRAKRLKHSDNAPS